jgi:sugar-specific transcriptional regulator TrmB
LLLTILIKGEDYVGFEPSEIQTLTDLGLTLIQAKVYLSLASLGVSKTAVISKLSNVARPDVYRTLTKLYEIGLVEKLVEAPVQFKALPIDEGVQVLLNKKQNEFEKIKIETDLLLGSFSKKKNQSSDFQADCNQFVLIPQKEAVINRLRQAINNAQNKVDVVISWKRFMHGIGNVFAENARDAAKRKINYRFIVEKAPSEEINECGEHFWKIYPSFQVRFISYHPLTVFGIYDNRELFVIIDPKSDLPGSPALWTNNQSLISLVQDYFNMLWQSAEEKPSTEQKSIKLKK